MMTFKMAYRNVLRQKRRTFLTVMAMLSGFTLASISIAWSDGTYNFVIDMFTRTQLGHIQVHGQGYLDKPTIYNTITDYEILGRTINNYGSVVSWTPRLFAAGLASVGHKSAAVRITGIDPVRETETTRFNKKITEGRMFGETNTLEVILGKGLAVTLKAELGSELVIVSQGADGSIANDLYNVVGVLESGDPLSDQTSLYLRLNDAQELMVLYDQAHEIAIVIEDLDDVEEIAAGLTESISQPRLTVEPWQEFARSFYDAMQADRQGMWIMLFIIVLIVSVGVLNTVLMTVLERTREYGVLRAIGVRPLQITRMVTYEVTVMATGSITIGFILSLGVNYWLSVQGISFGTFSYGGVEFSEMYSEINARSYIIPAITVFASAVLISLFPATKAARTVPAKAMRTH
jgi:ABC-type lipoprotein release transport system permease subunit